MSLLDRVQRKAEGTTSCLHPQRAIVPGTLADRRIVHLTRARIDSLQQAGRTGPAACPRPRRRSSRRRRLRLHRVRSRSSDPHPRPSRSAPPTLLNRTGGVARPGLSKMGGHVNTHVALRGKVHQRLVEELAQGTELGTARGRPSAHR